MRPSAVRLSNASDEGSGTAVVPMNMPPLLLGEQRCQANKGVRSLFLVDCVLEGVRVDGVSIQGQGGGRLIRPKFHLRRGFRA